MRQSSIDTLEKYKGTPSEQEAAAVVLAAAADHIYRRQDNGNPDNYRAIDLMDDIRADMMKTPGQLAYEEDVRRHPNYDDGSPRHGWEELPYSASTVEAIHWSWERNPTPRNW